jgi:uncharacterized protein YggE
MKLAILLPLLLTVLTGLGFAQASGNISYSQPYGKTRPEQNERNKRVLAPAELPPGSNTMFLEASVLMNARADEYVAVFGLAQEGVTVLECNQKMDAVVQEFSAVLKPLGIGGADLFVDFVAQNKIYGYRVQDNVAKEELVGFELKKNIAIHYRDKLLLDKLVIAASRSKIYDLIKVDYIVKDPQPIQDRLMEEAAGIIKRKMASYEKLLGIRLLPPPQVYAEKPSVYYPAEMYESYAAYEAERVEPEQYRSKYLVQNMRKGRTFFFNALNADGFDAVLNPVVVEPVVQFTLYLKVKYDMERQPEKKATESKP